MYKWAKCTFACLARTVYMQRQRMKDLLLWARVVARTSKMNISRRCLADYVKTLHQKACRTCSTITFIHSINQNNDFWRCRCRCSRRRRFLNSLITKQIISRRGKIANACEKNKNEKRTWKAWNVNYCFLFNCHICTFSKLLSLSSSWLLHIIESLRSTTRQ